MHWRAHLFVQYNIKHYPIGRYRHSLPRFLFDSTKAETRKTGKEKQLDTQQKFARELLDSVPAGFILLTPNGNIKQVNRQASAELGVQKQDIKNKNIREVFSIFHENINILDELLGRLQKTSRKLHSHLTRSFTGPSIRSLF
ncbi:MAG: PAS domain S-box protein [Butyricimonas faecalis]